jgi:hypothetical protein
MFLQDAQKYASHQGVKHNYIPFSSYWYHDISYRNLTPPQKDWYFYWRHQVRNGDFLSNDLSYIFLYTYEVLNLVGFKDVDSAYNQLVKIWKNYRKLDIPVDRYEWVVWNPKNYLTVRIHPIDRYLVDWIADFIVLHQLPINLLDWYSMASQDGAVLTDLNLMVDAWLRTNQNMNQMHNEILFALANYNPTHNKFYQDYWQIHELHKVYTSALLAVHDYLKTMGKGAKQLFARTNRKYVIKRAPFERVPHTYSRQHISVVEIPARVKQKTLANNLTGIVKYTDNIFRHRAGFRAKLRGFEIPEAWKTAIDSVFEIKPDPIFIDFSRVSEISERSEDIRARLIAELNDESSADNQHNIVEDILDPIEDLTVNQPTKFRLLFEIFRKNRWDLTQAQLQKTFENTFISVLIDEFNEWGFENLGDTPIVVNEEGHYSFIEEYRDDIATLVDDMS